MVFEVDTGLIDLNQISAGIFFILAGLKPGANHKIDAF